MVRQEPTEAVKEWLKDFTGRTAYVYADRLNKFFADTGKTAQDLECMTAKEIHSFLVQYQAEQQGRKVKQNSILSVITAVRSFCASLDKPIKFRKNQLGRIETDTNSHVFSNGDLRGLFEVGNTVEKAIIATAVSLGWEISSFLALNRAKIEDYLAHAKANGEQYVFFEDKRDKTGVQRLAVLNPLAIEWLTKYLELTKDSHDEKLFDYTSDGIEKMLSRLALQSRMQKTGAIRFHRIRAWLMSRLSRAGFNEWSVKYIIGHAIPVQERAYLVDLQSQIEEKYPKVYEAFLNINPVINGDAGGIRSKIETQENDIGILKTVNNLMFAVLNDMLDNSANLEPSKRADLKQRVADLEKLQKQTTH
jgi:integrase